MNRVASVERVLRRRLATQRLTAAPLPDAAEAVRLLTCVQSQERDHALFSLGLRSRSDTYGAVRAELDRGAFVRTHILRPTWHFVAPADLRWIQALTGPRVLSSMAARHRQLELDDDRVVGRALDALAALLAGRTFRTRAEIGVEFAARPGLPKAGEQLGHLLMVAELRGLICSGPTRGVHHSYALVEEVVDPTPPRTREEAVVELARRFFAGHGPAAVKDFTRWSGLTAADTNAALAQLGDQLEAAEVDGVKLWFDPARSSRATGSRRAFLFPAYDEAVLTYPGLGFPAAEGHPHDAYRDAFWALVVLDAVNVGLWKRTVRGATVSVDVRLAASLGSDARRRVRAGAERLAAFLERDLDYLEGSLAAFRSGSQVAGD